MKNIFLVASVLISGCCWFGDLHAQGITVPTSIEQVYHGQDTAHRRFIIDTLSTSKLWFENNIGTIDSTYRSNRASLTEIRSILESITRDSLNSISYILVQGTASPRGNDKYNIKLSQKRAENTLNYLKSISYITKFDVPMHAIAHGENWEAVSEEIKNGYDYPNREEVLAILNSDANNLQKKAQLIGLDSQTWSILTRDFMNSSRYTSVTIVTLQEKPSLPTVSLISQQNLYLESSPGSLAYTPVNKEKYRKTIMAFRSNLLLPGLNVGMEFPIKNNWSVGIDYYYPWAVSSGNKWCTEMLGLLVDAKYWFPGRNNAWESDSRLKGHAVGLFGGIGYYDFQNKAKGAQGEFVNFGIDYTYALPIANDKLRLEFNIGLGYIYTLYRPYYPSSDYSDLIKEPGIKYRSTNFMGPTKAGVSLVIPITVPVKKNPYKVKGGDR